jgi:hypothetical protein
VTTQNDFRNTHGNPLDESQGFSPLQCHGYWLMCEVAMRFDRLTLIERTSMDRIKSFMIWLYHHYIENDIKCYMVFYVAMITSRMTLLPTNK